MATNKVEATMIMKAALCSLINAVEKGKQSTPFGLLPGITVSQIREVYQCLPEVDEEYSKAREIITKAAAALDAAG